MTITKCDLCKKQIKAQGSRVTVTMHTPWHHTELCITCAKLILDFLKKNGLIKES